VPRRRGLPGRSCLARRAFPARARRNRLRGRLNGVLGEIAASAARTGTFLGERYRRLARRRGKRKALAAIARSILVIIFHLLADPAARFRDLVPGYYDTRISRDRKIHNHVRQLQALGLTVTIEEAA
jgi:transposase